jgi:hypothetical protein
VTTDPTKLTPFATASAGGFLPWLPWIGAVVVVGALAGGAGALGIFGAPAPATASAAMHVWATNVGGRYALFRALRTGAFAAIYCNQSVYPARIERGGLNCSFRC